MKEKIQELERQIAALPIGYISKKTINGKTRYYHQWTENGKKHSQYLRDGELEPLQEQIEQRKVLQAQLKELQAKMPKVRQPKLDFETSVIVGKGLAAMSQGVKGWGLRDCFGQLEDYLYSNESDRVCLVFGLRRTGKTTMLRQAIARMSREDLSRTVYIKARRSDTMDMMNRDLKKLFDAGFRYVFIDEVTLMRDFIDSAALFSDVFAAMGMKIILSGTDSLGFWLAMEQELYDRALMNISAMAGRCGPVSLPLTMKMSTPRTPPSGTMSPHGDTSIQRSAKTFSIPWPAMRQADISATCTLCMRPVS